MWIWFSWESRHDDERRSLGNTLSDSSAQSVSVATVKTDLNCSFVHIKSYMDIILVTQYHLYFIVVYYAFIMSRLEDCKIFTLRWWWTGCFQSLLMKIWEETENWTVPVTAVQTVQGMMGTSSLLMTLCMWTLTHLISSHSLSFSFINDQSDTVSICWWEDAAQEQCLQLHRGKKVKTINRINEPAYVSQLNIWTSWTGISHSLTGSSSLFLLFNW